MKRPAAALPDSSTCKAAKNTNRFAESDDDSLLQAYCKKCVRELSSQQKERVHANLARVFVMSSACTGSGMAELVHACVHKLFHLPSTVAFGCEKVRFKRDFVMTIVDSLQASHGCMFEDMLVLPERVAACKRHDRPCKVPERMDVHVCGFSCKDLSKLNTGWNREERDTVLRSGLGTSGRTFAALMNFANTSKPRTMILENVDELEDRPGVSNQNVEFLYEAMAAVGYSVNQRTVMSNKFALPQARKRIFFLCVHNESFGLSPARGQALVDKILDHVSSFEAECGKMYEHLLRDGHDLVQQELQNRQGRETSEVINLDAAWPREHELIFKQKGLSWKDLMPAAELKDNAWYQTLPRRQKEILNYHNHPASFSAKAAQVGPFTSLDLSQTLGRNSRGYDGVMQTLTPKACMWIAPPAEYKICPRIVMGIEAMSMQGFPQGLLMQHARDGSWSNAQLLDLAGNAFSSTPFAAVYLCLLAELPDPVETKHDRKGDNLQAILALMS